MGTQKRAIQCVAWVLSFGGLPENSYLCMAQLSLLVFGRKERNRIRMYIDVSI